MKTIKTKGKVALVEHEGQRRIVPLKEASNPEAFEMGMPWGVPWEEVELRASPDTLAAELRRRGIWTEQDLRANSGTALAAIQSVYGVDLSSLRKFAARHQEV
jgi:hypothetical protein